MKNKGPTHSKHRNCIDRLTRLHEREKDESKSIIKNDIDYIHNLSTRDFINLFNSSFAEHKFEYAESQKLLVRYANNVHAARDAYEKSKTTVMVKTTKCAHCGHSHEGLSVRLDHVHLTTKPGEIKRTQKISVHNIPYVTCPISLSKLDVVFSKSDGPLTLQQLRDLIYHTDFEIESGTEHDIMRIKEFRYV